MRSFSLDMEITKFQIIMASANEGLGTCWIGAFDEKAVKEIPQVPDDVKVVALTQIGYPAVAPADRGRKELKEIISYDKY